MADDNGEPSDDLVPAILDTAHQYNIQVSLQKEIKFPLDHPGDFPSSALEIVPPPKYGVGGGVLINTAYVPLIFFSSEKSWGN